MWIIHLSNSIFTSTEPQEKRRNTVEKKKTNVVKVDDYLSDTDPDEFANVIPFASFTQQEKEKHLLKLWKTAINLAHTCA